ncbi:MAG: hypothetical protein CMJ70_08140 [Planctomycetaceae bacterium]|nr:hypothetical protein [Planctomycetaceae bacterium]
MIDLTRAATSPGAVQTVPVDPGIVWQPEVTLAIDAPPDEQPAPFPEAEWTGGIRSGLCGAVAPRVLRLPSGSYRMYYSQILPRPGFPEGANDYDHASTRILSATSVDGLHWQPEPGVRLTPQAGGAGDFRVVSSEVVPIQGQRGGLRMYYECCAGPQAEQNSIRSAVSEDGGLCWIPEPGVRLSAPGENYMAPRIVLLAEGGLRLYCCRRGHGIISALSTDGGLTFQQEAGVRIAPGDQWDQGTAFAPEIVRIAGAGYRMYYAGYSTAGRADILTATSDDGLRWEKQVRPVLSPGGGPWDAAKCSEMCLLRLPDREVEGPRYRMVYEACDGTAPGCRGVWRVASATSCV